MGGMGQTTSRHFRDKLSMRHKALDSGIPVPSFSSLFNNDTVNAFADAVPAPWLIKPRHEASATGITKIHSKDELWEVIHGLGDDRHKYLVEKFEPGDVYHADSLTVQGKVVFCSVSRYLDTPFEVAHGGGIFRSQNIKNKDEKAIVKLNAEVMKAFGLKSGASHTEFIRSKATGKFYFLETASRVGGANIAEMVEAATGVNLWAEWAKIETAGLNNKTYKLPKVKKDCAGIVVSLSRYESPDYSSFDQPEIVWRMDKPWHVGMIVTADSEEKVSELLSTLTDRIAKDFHASLPAPKKSL
jgi:biotin carboxylase